MSYKPPTDDEAAASISELSGDTEINHCAADAILCDLLEQLGYPKLVAAFTALDKWYS